MPIAKAVAYYRVSTARQGASGLGLDAQRIAVRRYLDAGSAELLDEFTEVESGKRGVVRPKLEEALRLCQLTGATLVVAKLDRLSRDAAFLLTLQASGARFIACDMPDANNLTVGIMALVAQQEREAISARTKAALAAAKARGVSLGGDRGHKLPSHAAAALSASVRSQDALERARQVMPYIREAREAGAVSLRQIAAWLTRRGARTPRGGETWQASQVAAVISRLEN